jgi:hypothetical protein
MFGKLKKIIFYMSFLLPFVWAFCVAWNEADSCLDLFYTWNLLLPKENRKDIKNLIISFCGSLSWQSCAYGDDIYDPNQSVFLNILCKNVWTNYGGVYDSILKKKTFENFKIYDYTLWDEEDEVESSIDNCNYKQSNMNGCDLSKFLPKIFDSLMNDFFNVRHASIFWITSYDDNFDKVQVANSYSLKNFPWLASQSKYKLSEGICSSNTDYYKKTCKYLKNYIKSVRKLINKTEVLDIKVLWSNSDGIDCDNNFAENILYCWLLWDTNIADSRFINVLYNEYFWYHLFMSHYAYMLLNDYSYGDPYSPSWNKSSVEIQKDNAQKAYSVQEQLSKSKEAISSSLMTLSQIESSFPLHIWFMMYQEDAKKFMGKIWKIYSPIRTLYDKLRNVQVKKE